MTGPPIRPLRTDRVLQQPAARMKNGKIVVARLFSKYLGGSGGFVSQRMKMVDRDRFETISIYLSRLSDVPNELAEDGIECFYLSDAPLTSFRYSVLRRLQRVLREQAVDILQCNRHKATFYGALAARSGRVSAVISHVHGLNRCKNAGRRLMYRHLLSPRISCAMGCAEAVRDDIRKNYPGLQKKAMSLANSIDYDKYANAQIDKAEYRLLRVRFCRQACTYKGPWVSHRGVRRDCEIKRTSAPAHCRRRQG